MKRGDKAWDRFWSKVKKGPECWEWQACCANTQLPYGQFKVNGRVKRAHRVAWEMGHGVIPKGLNVCHTCDNPTCVRPSHLFLGTQLDNMADMVNKGRAATGIRNGRTRTKLSEVQVKKILKDDRTYGKIAKDYGVTASAVWSIKSRKTWKHIK